VGAATAWFPYAQRIGALSIGAGGLGIVYPGVSSVLTATSVAISGSGVLDVTDGAVIIDYTGGSPLGTIQGLITSGYNAGAWNGSGIRSSTASVTPGTAVGFAEATDIFTTFPATFAGQSVDATSVLLRYTLSGDADLNKSVDTVDFNLLAANFGTAGKRWSQGDFNFNTTVDTVDFNLLASKFSQSLPADPGSAPGRPVAPAAHAVQPFTSDDLPTTRVSSDIFGDEAIT